MRKSLAIVLGILTLSAMTIQNAAAYTVVPIKVTSAVENFGQSVTYNGHTYFVWTQWTTTSSKTDAIWLTIDGGAPIRVSDRDSVAFSGGVDPTTGTLIYQEAPAGSGDSNLYTYDLATGARQILTSLNSRYWDCCADIQGSTVIYSQNRFSSKTAPWTVYLYDTVTHAKTMLAQTTYGCACLQPGNIDGNYATWTKGAKIYVWDVAGGSIAAKLSPPKGKWDYNPFIVDPNPGISGDETLFWTRSGNSCGANVTIFEAPLAHLGNTTKLYTLPAGKDSFSISVDYSGGQRNLYFGRDACGSGTSNIYEIPNV